MMDVVMGASAGATPVCGVGGGGGRGMVLGEPRGGVVGPRGERGVPEMVMVFSSVGGGWGKRVVPAIETPEPWGSTTIGWLLRMDVVMGVSPAP